MALGNITRGETKKERSVQRYETRQGRVEDGKYSSHLHSTSQRLGRCIRLIVPRRLTCRRRCQKELNLLHSSWSSRALVSIMVPPRSSNQAQCSTMLRYSSPSSLPGRLISRRNERGVDGTPESFALWQPGFRPRCVSSGSQMPRRASACARLFLGKRDASGVTPKIRDRLL